MGWWAHREAPRSVRRQREWRGWAECGQEPLLGFQWDPIRASQKGQQGTFVMSLLSHLPWVPASLSILSHLGLPMLTLLDISTWSCFHPQNSLLGALKIGEQLKTAAVFGICPMFGKLPSDYANSLCHWQDSVPCYPLWKPKWGERTPTLTEPKQATQAWPFRYSSQGLEF